MTTRPGRAMTAAGYDVHWVTVARWRRQGWLSNADADHPLDVARAKLEAIAPLATGNPVAVEAKADGGERVADAELLRQESRKLSALSTQAWDAAEPKLEKLVRRRPGELALLVKALTECGQAAVDALEQAERIESSSSADRNSG